MVRGCTYFLAAGTYLVPASTGLVFKSSDSGATPITIQAVTNVAHGTSVGWIPAFVGQAVFTANATVAGPFIDFESDNWIINGAYNACGTPATEPFLPCRSGYGIQFNNNNGSNEPWYNGDLITTALNAAQEDPGAVTVSNITFEFIEIAGDADTTGTYCTQGLHSSSIDNGAQSANITLEYSYIHDTSNGPAYFDAINGLVVDHNWFLRDWSTSSCHSELGIRSAGTTGSTNNTISNNYFENMIGTAMIATPNAPSSTGAINGLYIYGNTFFCNSAEGTMGAGDTYSQCPGGDGYILLFNNTIQNVKIYNNDFDGAASGEIAKVAIGDGVATTLLNADFENNIFSNANGQSASQVGYIGCPGNTGGATCTSFTYGYTSYMNAPVGATDTSGTSQHTTTNPYVNAGTNTANANNYELVADTSAWTPEPLASPDPVGVTRTSSRGALQYEAASVGTWTFEQGARLTTCPAGSTSCTLTIRNPQGGAGDALAVFYGSSALGNVNTTHASSGSCTANCVSWVSGQTFTFSGGKILIGSGTYTIGIVYSTTLLSVTTNPGTQTDVDYMVANPITSATLGSASAILVPSSGCFAMGSASIATDCAYFLSPPSSDTSLVVNLGYPPVAEWYVGAAECKSSGTANYDTARASSITTATTSPTGPSLTLSGTNDCIVNGIRSGSKVTAINDSYTDAFSSFDSFLNAAYLLNTTTSGPTWTQPSARAGMNAIAFK